MRVADRIETGLVEAAAELAAVKMIKPGGRGPMPEAGTCQQPEALATSLAIGLRNEPGSAGHTRTAPSNRLDVSTSSGSAGTFDIRLDDRLLATTETPLLSAARILLDEGVDPNTMLEMWWAGATECALRGRIGWLARRRVVTSNSGAPGFAAREQET